MNTQSVTECELFGGPIDGQREVVSDVVTTLVFPMRFQAIGGGISYSRVYYERSGPAGFRHEKTVPDNDEEG